MSDLSSYGDNNLAPKFIDEPISQAPEFAGVPIDHHTKESMVEPGFVCGIPTQLIKAMWIGWVPIVDPETGRRTRATALFGVADDGQQFCLAVAPTASCFVEFIPLN